MHKKVCCRKCAESDFISRLKKVLDKKFRCRFAVVSSERELASVYYSLMPDMVVLDPDCQKIVKRMKEGTGYMTKLSELPFIVLLFPHTDEMEAHLLPMPIESVLPHNVSDEKITEVFAAAAKKMGFNVSGGKIKTRLVKGSLSVTIEVKGLQNKIYGKTTGINKDGLGARVNAGDLTYHELKKLTGRKCRIVFNEPSLDFLPAGATVLRVERSRDIKFDAFLAAAFNRDAGYGLDSASLNMLKELIKSQKDESIFKPDEE